MSSIIVGIIHKWSTLSRAEMENKESKNWLSILYKQHSVKFHRGFIFQPVKHFIFCFQDVVLRDVMEGLKSGWLTVFVFWAWCCYLIEVNATQKTLTQNYEQMEENIMLSEVLTYWNRFNRVENFLPWEFWETVMLEHLPAKSLKVFLWLSYLRDTEEPSQA